MAGPLNDPAGMRVETRPGWKRLAGTARRALYRLATPIDRFARRGHASLLPPAHLRLYYYGSWKPEAFERACQAARSELISRGLRPEHRVLDIGSGIGNLALGLADYLHGRYDGIEIHREALAWCQAAITPQHPAFRFHHADISSGAYNPGGDTPAAAYRFPFADESFDFVFLGSVFTHMLPDAVVRYVREISRVLSPAGVSVAGCFLLGDAARRGVETGQSFMSFAVEHPSGLCRLHDATVPEAAVALDEAFVLDVHRAAGLRIADIRRGAWWQGAPHDQDVLTATPDPDARPT